MSNQVEGQSVSPNDAKPVLDEVPKVTGEVHISYYVDCPHCGKIYSDSYDRKWFDNTMGGDFPIDDGWNQEFDAKCEGCGQEFIVDGFVH